jgi:hypothetical protein
MNGEVIGKRVNDGKKGCKREVADKISDKMMISIAIPRHECPIKILETNDNMAIFLIKSRFLLGNDLNSNEIIISLYIRHLYH